MSTERTLTVSQIQSENIVFFLDNRERDGMEVPSTSVLKEYQVLAHLTNTVTPMWEFKHSLRASQASTVYPQRPSDSSVLCDSAWECKRLLCYWCYWFQVGVVWTLNPQVLLRFFFLRCCFYLFFLFYYFILMFGVSFEYRHLTLRNGLFWPKYWTKQTKK